MSFFSDFVQIGVLAGGKKARVGDRFAPFRCCLTQ
jgi:hypothetical protein